jgi:hypothetical protein
VDGQLDDEQNNRSVEECEQILAYLEYGGILVQG